MAGALVALAIAVPASAQGKSGKSKGKNPAPPPSTSALPSAANPVTAPGGSGGGVQASVASPFAWMDDASLIEPGSVWLGVSMVRWHGSGLSETIVPVVDGAIGLAPRVQLGASVPRVAGGLGTTFFSAKIGVFSDEARSLHVAVSPTLEVAGGGVTSAVPDGSGRADWGLPVSVHVDSESSRIYASSGYFSPGIWYAGAGLTRTVSERIGVSGSFSHAWTTTGGLPMASPRRSEVSGGLSYDLRPNIAVFGSVGRTIRTAAQDGAGTTLGFGMSLTTSPASAR
jgi:hypothetical protein